MYSLQKHLQYSAWANGKLAGILANVDEKLWDQEVISSFPSLRKTLYHVWDAEVIWFERLKGNAMGTWPSATFTGTAHEALKLFADNSQAIADHFKDKDQAYLEQKISYKNLKGIEYTTPVDEIFFHLVNHGSFHRGQLITMLRQLQVTQLAATDLIAYVRL